MCESLHSTRQIVYSFSLSWNVGQFFLARILARFLARNLTRCLARVLARFVLARKFSFTILVEQIITVYSSRGTGASNKYLLLTKLNVTYPIQYYMKRKLICLTIVCDFAILRWNRGRISDSFRDFWKIFGRLFRCVLV